MCFHGSFAPQRRMTTGTRLPVLAAVLAALALLLGTELEVLRPLDGLHPLRLALRALELQHDLLRRLRLLVEDGLRLTAKACLLLVVPPLALGTSCSTSSSSWECSPSLKDGATARHCLLSTNSCEVNFDTPSVQHWGELSLSLSSHRARKREVIGKGRNGSRMHRTQTRHAREKNWQTVQVRPGGDNASQTYDGQTADEIREQALKQARTECRPNTNAEGTKRHRLGKRERSGTRASALLTTLPH